MFKTLQDYYTYLELDSKFKETFGLSSNLKPLLSSLKNEEEIRKCNFEICFNDFHFDKGKYIPVFSAGGHCYPNLEAFSNKEYLKERSLHTLNNKYKAKYFHLLYHTKSDKREAINAINCYFDFLEKNSLDLKDNLEIRCFLDGFENLIYLSEKVKYKQTEIIQFSKDVIHSNKVSGFSLFHLIDFIIKSTKLDLENKQYFFNIIENEISLIRFPKLREDFLKLAINLSQRLEKDQKKYQNLLGEHYIDEAKKEGGKFYVHNIYLEALKCFKKAGNKEKQDEVSKLIQDSKNSIKLNKIETKLESPEINKYFKSLDKVTNKLTLDNNPDTIYEYLILVKNIFPKASMLEDFKKSQLQELFTTITFDNNKNIYVNNSKGINSYQIHFQLFTLEHLKQVFYKGQSNNKITFESLKEYLENNTWYNNINVIINPDGSDNSFKWIDFILPPLKLFFEESEKDLKNKTNSNESYIIPIDSLTLKFEGVLRDFSNRIGAQTIEVDEIKTEQRIDFDKLFNNEKFISIIPEDDLAFFKFLFTRKGINLRNNIAHNFYTPKDYSVTMLWMLICAFLKLGNYEFDKKTNEIE